VLGVARLSGELSGTQAFDSPRVKTFTLQRTTTVGAMALNEPEPELMAASNARGSWTAEPRDRSTEDQRRSGVSHSRSHRDTADSWSGGGDPDPQLAALRQRVTTLTLELQSRDGDLSLRRDARIRTLEGRVLLLSGLLVTLLAGVVAVGLLVILPGAQRTRDALAVAETTLAEQRRRAEQQRSDLLDWLDAAEQRADELAVRLAVANGKGENEARQATATRPRHGSRPPPPRAPSQAKPVSKPCDCQPGDPLCFCLSNPGS